MNFWTALFFLVVATGVVIGGLALNGKDNLGAKGHDSHGGHDDHGHGAHH